MEAASQGAGQGHSVNGDAMALASQPLQQNQLAQGSSAAEEGTDSEASGQYVDGFDGDVEERSEDLDEENGGEDEGSSDDDLRPRGRRSHIAASTGPRPERAIIMECTAGSYQGSVPLLLPGAACTYPFETRWDVMHGRAPQHKLHRAGHRHKNTQCARVQRQHLFD